MARLRFWLVVAAITLSWRGSALATPVEPRVGDDGDTEVAEPDDRDSPSPPDTQPSVSEAMTGSPDREDQDVAQEDREATQRQSTATVQDNASGQADETRDAEPQEEAERVNWFREAAERGHPWAQLRLGLMYAAGRGVPQNDAEAVKWYRKAAEQNLPLGQTNLGVMYLRGQGVPHDEVEAAAWFHKAAAQDDQRATNNLVQLEHMRYLLRVRTAILAVLVIAVVVFAFLIAARQQWKISRVRQASP